MYVTLFVRLVSYYGASVTVCVTLWGQCHCVCHAVGPVSLCVSYYGANVTACVIYCGANMSWLMS